MEFIIKFAQAHETFRVAEIQALAEVESVNLEIVHYENDSPLCIVRLESPEHAARLVRRSILAQSIHQLYGSGDTLAQLHDNLRNLDSSIWKQYEQSSFKFVIDSYQGSRPNAKRLELINSFSYLPLKGKIQMSNPDEIFTIFDIWPFDSVPMGIENPTKIFLGRYIANSSRDVVLKFDLKKRHYISTTSMDSELALITANIALAAPGKIFYDPFVGTGSFPVACAHFGAMAWGSDIDGRSIRGEGDGKCLVSNFEQYSLLGRLGDAFAADITNSPIQPGRRIWDGIVCDPPYGVREGLRVLGVRDPEKTPWVIEKGIQLASSPDFIPPKKPYSFFAILDDILEFAARTLVDDGRLSFWMPTANEEDQQIPPPTHPQLETISICIQSFNRWSRRLITYRRIPDTSVSSEAMDEYNNRTTAETAGTTADELNPFRRGYFRKFES